MINPLREQARQLRQQMTEAERLLWDGLRHHRVQNAHFRRQQVIGNFIVDFYCATSHLVVEVDGPVHELQSERDRDRDDILRANNLRIIRFTNNQVLEHLPDVLAQISELVTLPTRSDNEQT